MAPVSERYGHVPVRSVMQIGSVDDGLRNRLWNLIRTTFFAKVPHFAHSNENFLPNALAAYALLKSLYHNYFKRSTDDIGTSYINAVGKLKRLLPHLSVV